MIDVSGPSVDLAGIAQACCDPHAVANLGAATAMRSAICSHRSAVSSYRAP